MPWAAPHGWSGPNDRIEAVTMANLAKTLGVRADEMMIEPIARNTWENVGCLHGWLRRAERVFVVSDTLHAQRAVRYACRQDSDCAAWW
jgi:uncharacterized SAM-binding protein YcdF (DUF218 family)